MGALATVVAALLQDGVLAAAEGEWRATQDRTALADRLDDPPRTFVSDSEVDAALPEFFPPVTDLPIDLLRKHLGSTGAQRYRRSWRPSRTAIRPFELLLHSAFADRTDPAFERLDKVLDDPATLPVAERGELAFLTPAAVERIRAGVADTLGERRRDALADVLESGVPEPVVEDLELEVPIALDDTTDVSIVDPRTAVDTPEALGRVATTMHFK